MTAFLEESLFFGMAVSLIAYGLGLFLKKKLKWAFLNPLLLSIIFVILFLQVFQIDYETYNGTACYLSYLLTPATVCLAIPPLSAAEAPERKSSGGDPGDRVRSDRQHGRHFCSGTCLWTESRTVCDASSKVHYHSDRYRRF